MYIILISIARAANCYFINFRQFTLSLLYLNFPWTDCGTYEKKQTMQNIFLVKHFIVSMVTCEITRRCRRLRRLLSEPTSRSRENENKEKGLSLKIVVTQIFLVMFHHSNNYRGIRSAL